MTVRKTTLAKLAVLGIALVAGLITLFASAFVIRESEQAIVTQFGEPIGDAITEPGLHWKRPFVQQVRRFDKRLLLWDGEPNQIPTLGREFISVDTMARWRIVEPLLFLTNVNNEQNALSRLDDIIDSVVRDIVSGTDLEEIVRSADWSVDVELVDDPALERTDVDLEARPTKGREQLVADILREAGRNLPQLGIELVDVRIKRLNYIDDVRRQVEERMISERQRIAEQFRSEGQGRAAEIEGETERDLQEIRSGARREAEEIRGVADAEATQIYGAAYGSDPEFYSFFQTLETYRRTMQGNTTLMLRSDSDFIRYLQDLSVQEVPSITASAPAEAGSSAAPGGGNGPE